MKSNRRRVAEKIIHEVATKRHKNRKRFYECLPPLRISAPSALRGNLKRRERRERRDTQSARRRFLSCRRTDAAGFEAVR
jgi:hypothetical protein